MTMTQTATEATSAVLKFRRRFGAMPDPDNPLHARWLCAQLAPDTMDRLIDEVFVEMTQEVLDELVAEGRAEVVGASPTGSPIYRRTSSPEAVSEAPTDTVGVTEAGAGQAARGRPTALQAEGGVK